MYAYIRYLIAVDNKFYFKIEVIATHINVLYCGL